MARLFGISFILILFVPFFGTWMWLQHRLEAARYDAASVIRHLHEDEPRVLWRFTKDESLRLLNWKHSKEFEYQGEMYDILRSETHGDSVWYWCYHDRQETKVRKKLLKLLRNQSPLPSQDIPQQNRITDFLKNLYLPDKVEFVSRHEASQQLSLFAPYLKTPLIMAHDPLSPPPKTI